MFLQMLLALLLAAVLLLGTHYFIYRSLVSAFDLTRPRVRWALRLAFTVLAISIPLAMLLDRLHGNLVTRTLHTLSSFWLGLALHLLFLLALGWAVHGISRLLGRPVALAGVVSVAAVLALAASSYGLWNANHPVVT